MMNFDEAQGWILGHASEILIFLFLSLTFWLLLTSRMAKRVWAAAEETLFANWRLGLLGATGLVLSLASGWTTWDGMRNFTGEPILSLMITFGIQGVMLIIAWLIGESFASGMTQQASRSPHQGFGKKVQAVSGGIIGALLFTTIATLVLFNWSGTPSGTASAAAASFELGQWADRLLIIAAGLLIAALVALYAASDLVKPYLQSTRVIVRNSMLWVMFLACMATSVFFSFDSLFSSIFPQDERVRAAELRAQNQVAGVVADIGETIEERRILAAGELFGAEGWLAYDGELDKLYKASEGADKEIEAHFIKTEEARRSAIVAQQERITTAESGKVGLENRKIALTEELSRLKAERPALADEYGQKKGDLDARAKEIDAKRVEAMAEDKGVEGTLKAGKGPIWRQRMSELDKLNDYYKVGEERVKDAKKRLDATETRIASIERELATIDGDLAKLKGEAETAGELIKMNAANAAPSEGQQVNPAKVRAAFERARLEFRQAPTEQNLTALHQQCTTLYGAMIAAEVTKEKVRGIDCDPKRAHEAAAVVFGLNAGSVIFGKDCAGGDKLAQHTTTDALFGFARKCLADSGLPSKETETLRTKINHMELARDDKAHRFVVTLNAFNDGNKLAYLALAIALAIDSLIFMSGLFGANAVRSPLSDVPSVKARSAQQLEAIVENALLPDTFDNARMTLAAMRPITNEAGFMAEVRPDRLDPHSAERVLQVLNAGATIHAVEYDEPRDRYLVRAELFEFLSFAAKKAFEKSGHHASVAELENIVGVALLPEVGPNAETVLAYMHPISEDRGFTAEVRLDEVTDGQEKRLVRNVLNAGATLERVQRVTTDPQHYFIHKDLYKTLARIRARSLFATASLGPARIDSESRTPIAGGSLSSKPRLEAQPRPALQLSRRQPAQGEPMQAEFLPTLLGAMGLDLAAYEAVARPESQEQALAAGKALEALKRSNTLLGQELRARERELRERVHASYQALWGRQSDDEARIEALNEVWSELDRLIPALMLSRRGPYEQVLWQLINELEAAAGDGHLSDHEQQALDRLREHAAALALVNRDSPDAWDKIGALVFAWDDASGSRQRITNA